MENCWQWDSHDRPTFSEIRAELNDIFGEIFVQL